MSFAKHLRALLVAASETIQNSLFAEYLRETPRNLQETNFKSLKDENRYS